MINIVLRFIENKMEDIKKSLIEKYNNSDDKPVLEIVVCEDVSKINLW